MRHERHDQRVRELVKNIPKRAPHPLPQRLIRLLLLRSRISVPKRILNPYILNSKIGKMLPDPPLIVPLVLWFPINFLPEAFEDRSGEDRRRSEEGHDTPSRGLEGAGERGRHDGFWVRNAHVLDGAREVLFQCGAFGHACAIDGGIGRGGVSARFCRR